MDENTVGWDPWLTSYQTEFVAKILMQENMKNFHTSQGWRYVLKTVETGVIYPPDYDRVNLSAKTVEICL